MTRDYVAELETLLRGAYQTLRSTGSGPPIKFEPALDPIEAEDFLRGLERGLFHIEADGYVRSEFLPPGLSASGPRQTFQLFWHRKDGLRHLFREGICQLAAASALVCRYGWPQDWVAMEPSKQEFGPLAYAVDLFVRDPDEGDIIIAGEAKRTHAGLRHLLHTIRSCGSRPPHARAQCEPRDRANHPKAEFCQHWKPQFFWAICPGTRWSFELRYDGPHLVLREADDIPSYKPSWQSKAF